MNVPRLIPVLLVKNGLIVRSQLFRTHQVIGNPMSTIMRYSNWNVDELIVLDISADGHHDLRRDDLHQKYGGTGSLDVLREIARVCYMPLTFGGRIRTVQDIRQRLLLGADKVALNTAAVEDPTFVTKAAEAFGAQCIVVSIDVKRHDDGTYEVYTRDGKHPTGLDPAKWAAEAEALGAGEILLNSIDRDGAASGYDLDLVRRVTGATTVPVIACGGVGEYSHVADGVLKGGASAVAAGNIFHFFELSYPIAKATCIDAGLPMRSVGLGSEFFPREPRYGANEARTRVETRLALSRDLPRERPRRGSVGWCRKCVYPTLSAVPLDFDRAGVCTGCQVADAKEAISAAEWERRKELLRRTIERHRPKDGSNYDCIIPVSGGKDSYFQTHVIKNELGFNPLLVTYNGNNWTPTGWRNVHRMKEAFGVDHVFYQPSVPLLQKLNRLAFTVMGDMNWHAHVGIMTLPVRVAAQFSVPILIYGEHGYADLGGQFSFQDFPEISYRGRLEHFARGYEWNYFVGMDGITAQDMLVYRYPSDRTLYDVGVRGLHLGHYVHWEANEHVALVIEKYGWEASEEGFDRTYRRMSNLDDMHENGVHDYMKFMKFGYGRCSDHASKDIRAGLITREEGVELVRKYDHVKPRDLARWLSYVGMSEDEFDAIADTFRDPRVWWRENGEWKKDNIWDARP